MNQNDASVYIYIFMYMYVYIYKVYLSLKIKVNRIWCAEIKTEVNTAAPYLFPSPHLDMQLTPSMFAGWIIKNVDLLKTLLRSVSLEKRNVDVYFGIKKIY